MLIITEREQFPEWIRQYPQVKGFCIGGCIRTKKAISCEIAHAHPNVWVPPYRKFSGFICSDFFGILGDRNVLLHEVAHLVSGDPHTAKFKHTLLNMGGTLEMYYCPYANAYAKSCHDLHDLTVWEEVKKATIEVKRATIEVKRALIEEVFHWITGR